ncbi:MAG TPA: hypothetical protein VG433_05915 [Pirellulales bacterium]|nr:hypothetical protein [Pirellulales bacterium]
MTSATLLTAILTLGVHWGWQPVAGGGIEYIIRIDPFTVDSMRQGHDVFSDLPPSLPAIRSYRVTVSDKPVPHEGEPPPAAQPKSVSAARPPAEATGQPSLAGELQLPPPPTTGSNLFPPPRLVSPTSQPAGAANSPARASAVAAAPIAQHSGSTSSETGPPAAASTNSATNSATSAEPAKPWGPLAGVSIGLFASLAANAWLVWMALGFRAKYLAQVARLKPTA